MPGRDAYARRLGKGDRGRPRAPSLLLKIPGESRFLVLVPSHGLQVYFFFQGLQGFKGLFSKFFDHSSDSLYL